MLEPPRAAEVVVKICASGICATDLHLQHGDIPYRFPCVLGHEGAGIVVALGSACTSLEIGDKVLCVRRSRFEAWLIALPAGSLARHAAHAANVVTCAIQVPRGTC